MQTALEERTHDDVDENQREQQHGEETELVPVEGAQFFAEGNAVAVGEVHLVAGIGHDDGCPNECHRGDELGMIPGASIEPTENPQHNLTTNIIVCHCD